MSTEQRRRPPAKWTLPEVVDPPGRKLITLCIPDEKYHIAAFRGALWNLCAAYNWKDDEAHTAKDVAKVWRDVINEGDMCMDFRQDGCHLYWQHGGTEELIYNGQECIDSNIADGTIKSGYSNSGLGDKTGGTCYPYTFELSPLEIYYIPQLVNAGDTLDFVEFSGGTTDVTGLGAFWHCPTGQAYELGHCASSPRPGSLPDDPAPAISHASLMIRINGVYYDAFNAVGAPTTVVVPAGVTNALCAIVLNYGNVIGPTATGSVKGTVQWCRNSLWCHNFDFTLDNGGFVTRTLPGGSIGTSGVWTAGQGWQASWWKYPPSDFSGRDLNINHSCSSTAITKITSWYTWTVGSWGGNPDGTTGNVLRYSYNGGNGNIINICPIPASPRVWTGYIAGVTNISVELWVGFLLDHSLPDPGGTATLSRLQIEGVGANPFGANNCA